MQFAIVFCMDIEWISLSEAADLLGVHPATIRTWGDKGELPMQRTPGGHRRFRRADVEARLDTADRSQTSGVQLVVQNMVGRARLELSDGALNDEGWYLLLDEAARQQLRQIGHQLLHLFQQYLVASVDLSAVRAKAKQIGQDYERLGRRARPVAGTNNPCVSLFSRIFVPNRVRHG